MRPHLVELEDLAWLPATIRDLGTDLVRFLSERRDVYRPVAGRLNELLDRTGRRRIQDLRSGAGGGWLSLLRHLDALGAADVTARLSDRHPTRLAAEHLEQASDGRISYAHDPVDVLNAPPTDDRVRSMMLAFHHFRPDAAKAILQSAVDARTPIAVFDLVGFDAVHALPRAALPLIVPLAFLANTLMPVLVLLLTPRIRPFQWKRLLLTYLVPIVPLDVWWDATVSVLRAYTVPELRSMIRELDDRERFAWDVGRVGGRGPRAVIIRRRERSSV